MNNESREDLRNVTKAIKLDFSIINEGYGNPMTFIKGLKRIWQVSEGWQCAELTEGYFKNHRKYPTLLEALIKEGE